MNDDKKIQFKKINLTPKEELLLEGKRKQLIKTLQQKGINDKNVLSAISRIPRHVFFDIGTISYDKETQILKSEGEGISVLLEHIYSDRALPIGKGQTISHPYTVAFQTQALNIRPNDKVLEIGTGSGYQTAVLLEMGATVYTIERIEELYLKSKFILQNLGYKNFYTKHGDGYLGWPENAPYDKIIVTATAQFIPDKLLTQLKENGKMIIPVENEESHEMLLFTRQKNNTFIKEKLGDFKFVPMLYNKE